MVKGFILVASEGSRLRPFTYSHPKNLIPLLGKLLIHHLIEDLVGSRYGARLRYITQERGD